ncbi:MAG: M43 family zinc metalloprotease [Nocardioidaceae bacterium]
MPPTTPFRFRLNSISRTKSNRWYNANALDDRGFKRLKEMQRTLHVGNTRHLNMYTVGPKFRLLGYAFYPTVAVNRPKLDGVVLFNASLPGGNADYGPGSVYNRGDTATHEVGHWLNLYHTFQGGCSRLNDYVTDTQRQKAGDNIFEEDPTLNTCRPYTRPVKGPGAQLHGVRRRPLT